MSNFQDIVDFLATYPPFDMVDLSALEMLATRIAIVYVKAGQKIAVNEGEPCLRMLRSGSVEIRSDTGVLLDRLSIGGCFGYGPLLTGDRSTRSFTILEDGLLYLISRDDFSHLRHNYPEFDYFFAREARRRADNQNKTISRDVELSLRLEQIMERKIAAVTANESITAAAQKMTELRVSSLLVCADGRLQGILTDRDLRSRVVAKNLDMNLPVECIMTLSPRSLSPSDSLHQAYLTMMSEGFHHLPITVEGQAVGIISLSDLIRARNSEPLFLIQAIKRGQSVAELSELAKLFPHLIEKLILAEVNADEVGRIISTLTDSLTMRLLALAIERLGPPPCAFSWLAFGSQGRKEQTLNSDQDNSLLVEDSASQADIDFFLQLASFVCDGLDECGVRHCPGGIMAMNAQWCLRLGEWKKRFMHWIDVPEPEALLNVSIFYDMRLLCGDSQLYKNLQETVFKHARGKSIFLACLLQNALSLSPPLGFFKTFVLERDGDHNSVLDLKLRGTIPIVDLARLYTLAEGIPVSNTLDRLKTLKSLRVLHSETADNLSDAHRFIADIRLSNQQKQLMAGSKASNSLDPKHLSPLVRHQLKDAFSVVQDCQQAAKVRFGHGVL